jgi:hypothetical protein
MPRYKALLILILFIALAFLFFRSEPFSDFLRQVDDGSKAAVLPLWLKHSHRSTGPYVSDYIPLDPDDLSSAPGSTDSDNGQDNGTAPDSGAYVNPSGSPYAPGTLADMIWQQKQQDRRYGN